MDAIDRDALTRALAACRAESAARAQQIFDMLSSRPWETVAKFASYSSQIESLGLPPWQDPPCYARLCNLAKPFGDPRGERESAEILRRMISNNLSRFEPDPLRAIAEAEQRQAAK
jgi:hypothetical protein